MAVKMQLGAQHARAVLATDFGEHKPLLATPRERPRFQRLSHVLRSVLARLICTRDAGHKLHSRAQAVQVIVNEGVHVVAGHHNT
jgi:hypothetical protein